MAILIHIKLIDQLGTYFHRWNLKIPDFLYITIVCSLTSNDKLYFVYLFVVSVYLFVVSVSNNNFSLI